MDEVCGEVFCEGITLVISAAVLAPQTLIIGWLLYAPLVMWAILRAPWVELLADRRRQHLLFGTVFALFMPWLLL